MFSGLPSCTKRDLLSLLGKLNFAASVVVAGHTFMRRWWDATLAVPEQHNCITLRQSCHADLAWWRYPLDTWNGRSFFLQPGWSHAPHMHLFPHASGTLGHGAFLAVIAFLAPGSLTSRHALSPTNNSNRSHWRAKHGVTSRPLSG